ncbi:MAG: penicillin-binding transpeptidase domain-containing protein, partial [Alphaproteobacteria bacterium]|nr:penicillin-binding transpeptidase domain-containing protein [Alphaproteobacteria bacterium]
HFNRATLGVYELGSIFKVFTAAMALENGGVKQEDRFETALPLQIGPHIINDFHGQNRPLTVHEIVVHSSNIGAAQLALATTPQTHREFLDRLGLTQRADFELPELAHPIMPDYWHDIQRATSAYGHGIAVSLLQALTAGAAMINGGILYRPRLIDDGKPFGVRVVSEDTSAHMRHIMRAVVTSGTASKANLSGFPILGKTGTADKVARGGYDRTRSIASFMGAFPAHAPQYAFIVMLDEPQALAETAGMATAGWNVVPIAAKIVRRIAPLLDIMPMRQAPQTHQAHKDTPAAPATHAENKISRAEIEQATPPLYEEKL